MSEKKGVELRDYQKECLDKIEEAGPGRHVIAIATGLGKTVIFANMKRRGRTLILSHRDELVRQPEKYYDCSFGVEKAEEHSNGEDVVSASVQTLSGDRRLSSFSPDEFDTIIVDECLTAGTIVNGKPIWEFSEGDEAISFDHRRTCCDMGRITHVFARPAPSLLFRVAGRMTCTANHPVYTANRGYVRADSLRDGDVLITLDEAGLVTFMKCGALERISRGTERYRKLCPDGCVYNLEVGRYSNYFADGILVHNCHHAASPSYKKILSYFSGADRILGFTATPRRGDGARLDDVFEDIIFARDLKWGIEHGYLSRIKSVKVTADYDLSSVAKIGGDYSPEALEKVMEDGGAVPLAARAYVGMCHEAGRRTLIYCVSKRTCRLMLNTVRSLLPESERESVQMVSGDTPADERADILRKFSDGRVRAIVNCMVLTEGTDLPVADCIMNMRPTCNDSLYQQIVGRGLRLSPGKEECLVIDVLPEDDGMRTLCSAPTLFGVDPKALDKKTRKKMQDGEEDLLDLCNAVATSMANAATDLSVRIENVNLFLDKWNGMVDRAGNVKELAEEIAEDSSSGVEGDGIDFLGMDVSVRPDEDVRYLIRPNWYDEIRISVPDVMDMANIEFRIGDGGGYGFPGRRIFAGRMKMEDAVRLAREYCDIQDYYYSFSWNRAMQEYWSRLNLTESQQASIERNYGGRTDVSNAMELDRLSASRLIGMDKDAKKEERRKKLLMDADRKRESKKRSNARKMLEKEDAEDLKLRQKGAEEFDAFKMKIESLASGEESEKEESDENAFVIRLYYDYYPGAGRPCTVRQSDYIKVLLSDLEGKGICAPELDGMHFTARQASVAISVLKDINSGIIAEAEPVSVKGMEKLLNRIEAGEKPKEVRLSVEPAEAEDLIH